MASVLKMKSVTAMMNMEPLSWNILKPKHMIFVKDVPAKKATSFVLISPKIVVFMQNGLHGALAVKRVELVYNIDTENLFLKDLFVKTNTSLTIEPAQWEGVHLIVLLII